MDRRYQVFLSSTYEDLKEERLEVMKALLELDCIPCGMEYFPAANEDQWTYIASLIDDCDYYVVIVGGRYGSTDAHGVSYTQKEYEYAVSKGIPVIAFLHGEPGKIASAKTERTQTGREKLEEFRRLCYKRLCKEWTTLHELGAVVSRSLTQLIKRNPRSGWVRADALASEEASREILELRRTVERQREDLEKLQFIAPAGAERLAQGDERIGVECKLTLRKNGSERGDLDRLLRLSQVVEVTWDELLMAFAPDLMSPANEVKMKSAVSKLLGEKCERNCLREYPDYSVIRAKIAEGAFQTIKIQFLALGLIAVRTEWIPGKGETTREIRLCELTPLGKRHLLQEKAVFRKKQRKAAL